MKRQLMFITALFCIAAPAAAQSTAATLRALLPSGRVAVEVMEQWSPPRLVELTQKLQRAVAADPAWWQEHVRKAPPGKPVTYDLRLGLTEVEYDEFLRIADSSRLRPARVDTVAIVTTATGWRFDETSTFAPVRGIEIDTVTDIVRTRFGALRASTPIAASAGQRVSGPWGGPRWRLEEGDSISVTGVSAHFAIGRHESGQTIVYLDAKSAEKGRLTATESFFLRVVK